MGTMVETEAPARFQALREARVWNQNGVATAVGMARSTYADWETRAPSALVWLAELCDLHGVSADFILGRTDDPKFDSVTLGAKARKVLVLMANATSAKRAEIIDVVGSMLDWDLRQTVEALSAEERTALIAVLIDVEGMATVADALGAFQSVTKQEDPKRDREFGK